MTSNRRQIIAFIKGGSIPEEKIEEALRAARLSPAKESWQTFLDRLFLWLGTLALSFSAMFFIAYNWGNIGRLTKFGLVEGLLAITIAAYCLLPDRTTVRKVPLLAATIILGVLLGLYGQTYQTGADPWQLFFSWALLMLPWAVISRLPAIWIVWVILINITIVQYYRIFPGFFRSNSDPITTMLWLTFILNSLALTVWELLTKKWTWLSERWAIRLLAVGSGIPMTWLVLDTILSYRNITALPPLLWLLWLTAMYLVYRKLRADLFMLAGCCLSIITITVTFTSRHILTDWSAFSFLLLALLVIGLGSAAAAWLKNIHREIQP